MKFVNPPEKSPHNVTHGTFYSQILRHDVGYNIYLPPGYAEGGAKYPVACHLHGWQGDESSDIWHLEEVYRRREAITVFPNANTGYDDFPGHLAAMGAVLTGELIPYIEARYQADASPARGSVSGFSMGGGMAFYYAVRYPEVFGSVTAYAGTFHHYFHTGYSGVKAAPAMAVRLYEEMMRDERDLDENNILCLVRQNAEKIRDKLNIQIHVGTADILLCDSEILHLYLNSLNIAHGFWTFAGAGHELDKIL